MCNNRKYTQEEQMAIEQMTRYAKKVLTGISIETIAMEENITADAVNEVLEGIKAINPYLYNQVKEKLAS